MLKGAKNHDSLIVSKVFIVDDVSADYSPTNLTVTLEVQLFSPAYILNVPYRPLGNGAFRVVENANAVRVFAGSRMPSFHL